MNPTHSQNQIPNPESFPPSFITTYYEDTQGNNITPQVPAPPGASASPGLGTFLSLLPSTPGSPGFRDTSVSIVSPVVHPGTLVASGNSPVLPASNYHVTSAPPNSYNPEANPANTQNWIQPVHPTDFFYRPPNDFCHYHVYCKEISYDTIECLLNNSLNGFNIQSNENENVLFYQQQYNYQFYQISCKITSPTFINNYLNKNILGIEIEKNTGQEQLTFTFDQKENLKRHLKQYLSQYLLN